MVEVGENAPELGLPDETGKVWKLGDLTGKKVVLYFYPRDDTPGCTIEACSFRDRLKAFKEAGAVVIGVSADSVESHKKFKEKHLLNFPLLSDEKRIACGAYGVWREKNLYGKKFMGIVRTTFLIDSQGMIAHVFPKVNPLGHDRQV